MESKGTEILNTENRLSCGGASTKSNGTACSYDEALPRPLPTDISQEQTSNFPAARDAEQTSHVVHTLLPPATPSRPALVMTV
ncbi:hypothetical protein E2C01_048164 [Portunus trituberculatus]|uniref:Uncharacterized protein n=1 Tax=Portunus trituberculatus TaxID=210409 RepID=A0A5B7GCH8_PORTR|nr:hypothetical protein [Portunus trituberculatus]